MKAASITEAKNRLSTLIDRVRAGETIVITDRGLPVARLEPVTSIADPTGRLLRLERAGLVRTGSAPISLDRLRVPGPPVPPGQSAVAALIDERRSGR